MDAGSQSPFTGFKLGALTIDLQVGSVYGETLTPRAEDLLLLLARRANTLVSREDILETVWAGRVVEDAAITNCVWQIRRALGDDGKDILQTRTKRGYVLVVPDSAWIRELGNAAVSPAQSASDATADAAQAEPAETASVAAIQAQPASPSVVSAPAPPPRSRSSNRRPWWIAAAALLVCALAFVGWRQWVDAAQTIVFEPQVEMSVGVLAPSQLDWVRETLLRKTIEQTHLRDIEVVVFQRAQRRNPFRGPHLQIEIGQIGADEVEAQMRLVQGDARLSERYRGSPEGLPNALQTLLSAHLPATRHAPGAATDAFVAGRLAEARFDHATAQLEYRRALTLDPALSEGRIALAGLLFDQGRADEARAISATLEPARERDPVRRCRIERLLARLAAQRLTADACPRARLVARVERLQLRDALRSIERLHAQPAGALEWLEEEDALILALLRLQELDRAEFEIGRARRLAEAAGWPHGALRLQANLGPLHMHRGERREAAKSQSRVADAFAALGDRASAAESRIWVMRADPLVPGPAAANRRARLRTIIDDARAAGNVKAEIEALLLLARVNRDLPEQWRSDLDRARTRIREAQLDGGNSLHPYFLVAEIVGQRRYRDALAEIDRLRKVPVPHPRADAWALYLQVESHFRRDEIGPAIAALDAMERGGLDITASPNPCFFAWVLTEAGRRDRANAYLERCRSGERSPEQTDYGLIAAARRRILDGERAGAWPLLRPRIDALSALAEPSRQEAEILATLTRYAIGLPGADQARLLRAQTTVERVAALDGAGPGLRLGALLLRRELCASRANAGCAQTETAAALPAWASEDFLEVRLGSQPAPATRRVLASAQLP